MDRSAGAGVAGGRFPASAVRRDCQTGGYSILDIDLYGNQPGGICVAGLYRRSAGAAEMVCVNPAGGDQHPDVLSSDVYSLLYFQDVACWLEAAARFTKRRYRVVEVDCVLAFDRSTDGLAREAEVQVVGLVLSCCQVGCHQVPRYMKDNSDLYISIFPIIKGQPQTNKERAKRDAPCRSPGRKAKPKAR